ncbi:MAG TPA: cytochrome P450 [Ramlibacter sp.]|nr:cytochrome P450 [Ramlibacter sp.]
MSGSDTSAPSFPMARQCPFHPPAQYKDFQQQPGATRVRMWDGSQVWLFTRYEDVRAVLADRRFSGDPSKPGFPSLSASRDSVLEAEPAFIRMDPPQHGHYRRMITREFMIKKVAALQPKIEQLCHQLIDRMLQKGPPAELVGDVFLPLTSQVIGDMLDVPYEDAAFFQEQSSLRVQLDVDPEVPKLASRRILDYLDKLVTAKEQNPGDDLISRLVVEQVQTGQLTHRELVVMADLLLMAGHETTANQMALGVYSLLTNPEQLRLLQEDGSRVKNAVEEMLRFHSIVHYNAFRVAQEDLEIAGTQIRKGEGVIALVSAANRDPAAFEHPDAFDITRKADHHVAFSFGVHQCLGQPLARVELQTMMTTLFQRVPTLRFAVPAEQIKAKDDHFVMGLKALPVAW